MYYPVNFRSLFEKTGSKPLQIDVSSQEVSPAKYLALFCKQECHLYGFFKVRCLSYIELFETLMFFFPNFRLAYQIISSVFLMKLFNMIYIEKYKQTNMWQYIKLYKLIELTLYIRNRNWTYTKILSIFVQIQLISIEVWCLYESYRMWDQMRSI